MTWKKSRGRSTSFSLPPRAWFGYLLAAFVVGWIMGFAGILWILGAAVTTAGGMLDVLSTVSTMAVGVVVVVFVLLFLYWRRYWDYFAAGVLGLVVGGVVAMLWSPMTVLHPILPFL